METKTFKFEVKSVDEKTGQFEGYAAVFANIDKSGDVIDNVAFDTTIAERKEYPLMYMHDPHDLLGITRVRADNFGLKFDGYMNMDVQSAREKLSLLKQGAIKATSIAYDAINPLYETGKNGEAIRRLREIKLYEVSILPPGYAMNDLAQITSVKMQYKPYPNEHACRLREPGDFESDSFRRMTRKSDGREYSIIVGRLKGKDTMSEQAYRYPKKTWTEEEARKHCNAHDGSFEAASAKCEGCTYVDDAVEAEKKEGRVFSAANLRLIQQAAEALSALIKAVGSSGDDAQADDGSPKDKDGKSEEVRLRAELKDELLKLAKSYGG